MDSSTTRSVMDIPEIRSHIFSYSTPHTNFSNALVCKSWSDDALNALWREVEGPGCLFQLLAPLQSNEDAKFEFSRFLSPDDWLRFDKYAWRVYSLDEFFDEDYTSVDDLWSDFDPTVLTQLAATRPRSGLLPNLRVLHYSGPAQFSSMFFSTKLETFYLDIPSELDRSANDHLALELQAALPFICAYSPRLEILKIDFRYPCVAALELVLTTLLSGLPALTVLRLPSSWLTKLVTHAVASHPRLRTVHSANPECSPLVDPLKINDVFSSSLSPENFPSLQDLALVIPFSRATQCLSGAYLPSNLTSLQLTSPTPDSPTIFGGLVEVIARGCPQLQRLELKVRGSAMDASEQVDIGTISPLFKCIQLKFLDLRHPNPFILSSDDVVSIAKALPCLDTLILNHEPVISQPPTLRLSALLKLPEFCPNIDYLGLYMDATGPIEPIADVHLPRFPLLRVLSVGRSPISDPLSVAGFLGRILPAEASIKSPLSGFRDQTSSPWDVVDQTLKVILAVREEQRQRDIEGPI